MAADQLAFYLESVTEIGDNGDRIIAVCIYLFLQKQCLVAIVPWQETYCVCLPRNV